MDFLQQIDERVQDEWRRKMTNRIIDHLIKNADNAFDLQASEQAARNARDGYRFEIRDFLRTKSMNLKGILPPFMADKALFVSVAFEPVWSEATRITEGSHGLVKKGPDLVSEINLNLPTAMIGLGSHETERLHAAKRFGNGTAAPLGWERTVIVERMTSGHYVRDNIARFLESGRSVLFHELNHMMDRFKNWKSYGDIERAHSSYPNLDGREKLPDAKYKSLRKAYFNHPIETNAFYLTALNDVLNSFDKDGLSADIIANYSQQEFISAVIARLGKSTINYEKDGLTNKNKQKLINRLSTYYNDVLIPHFRNRNKRSFQVTTQQVTPETRDAIQGIRLKAEAQKKRADQVAKRKAKLFNPKEPLPTEILGPERYGFNGWTRDRYPTPEDAIMDPKGFIVIPSHNDSQYRIYKDGTAARYKDGKKIGFERLDNIL